MWNTNSVNGVLAVFNVQGSSWSRSKRKFNTHNKAPSSLSSSIKPADVDTFATTSHADAEHSADTNGSSSNGTSSVQKTHGSSVHSVTEFAMYSTIHHRLRVVPRDGSIPVQIAHAECDMFVVAPIQQLHGLKCAPLGLVNMLNGGGSVVSTHLSFVCAHASVSSNGVNRPSSSKSAVCEISLKGCGSFAVFANKQPTSVSVAGKQLEFQYSTQLIRFDILPVQDLQCTVSLEF